MYYKSVNKYGESPNFNETIKWDLPILNSNGDWIPGAWKEVDENQERRIVLTKNPYVWIGKNDILYECEVSSDSVIVSKSGIGAIVTVTKARLLKPFSGCVYGNKHIKEQHYLNGVPHRDSDLPAIIYHNGTKKWYQNGKLHRDDDQPAAIYFTRNECWHEADVHHRDNELCFDFFEGNKYWYQNGKLHRDGDRPAIVLNDGHKEWYVDGEFIRR